MPEAYRVVVREAPMVQVVQEPLEAPEAYKVVAQAVEPVAYKVVEVPEAYKVLVAQE